MIKGKTIASLLGLATFVLTAGSALAQGQSGTTLSAEKTAAGFSICVGPLNQRGVEGQVCVTNGGAVATQDLMILDHVQYKSGRGQFQDLTGAWQLIVPAPLGPGETACYPYRIVFDPPAGHLFRNVATVTITNHSGWLPGGQHCPLGALCPFGPEPKVDFTVPPPQDCTSGGCTLTQGFWKNHPNQWPVSILTLGTVSYTKVELLSILGTPVRGNGLLSLAHQLIAAKLNIANGADPSAVAAAIAAADALIGSLEVPPVGGGYLDPDLTGGLTTTLDNYNKGLIGPGHCDE